MFHFHHYPPSSIWNFYLLHILSNIFQILDIPKCTVVLICITPVTNHREHIFICLFVVSFSLLMKCLSKSLDYLKVKLIPNYWDLRFLHIVWGASRVVLVVKNPPANTGGIRDMGLMPGLRRSPGGKHSNPLQYSCLENPVGRGAWRATVSRVAKSQTWMKRLSTHTCTSIWENNTESHNAWKWCNKYSISQHFSCKCFIVFSL